MQRNVLCSVISRTFRGAGTSVARVRWTARYVESLQRERRGNTRTQRRIATLRELARRRAMQARVGRTSLRFAWAFCACALPIPKECSLGTISGCDLVAPVVAYASIWTIHDIDNKGNLQDNYYYYYQCSFTIIWVCTFLV